MAPSCRRSIDRKRWENHQPRRSPPPGPPRTLSSDRRRYAHPKLPVPRGTVPEFFIIRTARRLVAIEKPSLRFSELKELKASVSGLDFATGKPVDSNGPVLLKLNGVPYMRDFVHRVTPWIEEDGAEDYKDFTPDPLKQKEAETAAKGYFRIASHFSCLVRFWLESSRSGQHNDSLFGRTAWREQFDKAAARYLGPYDTDDYIWDCVLAYHNLEPIVCGEPPCLPSMPHAVCHVVDSTPFDDCSIRMSELKSIVFHAIANNMKTEYNHLGYFGVTVLSFWYCSVRIVQGLVNFRTYDIDLRKSPVQHFQNGFWLPDGSIDERFLTFLDYNCSKVVPLPR